MGTQWQLQAYLLYKVSRPVFQRRLPLKLDPVAALLNGATIQIVLCEMCGVCTCDHSPLRL